MTLGKLAALAASSLVLFALGCNKGPAEDALAAADQALAAARPDLERYLEDELASLGAAMAAARADLEKGRYTEALKTAQSLPGRIAAAEVAAARKKQDLAATWAGLAGSLPGALQALADRLAALAGAASLPRGMTPDRLAGYQGELNAVDQAWKDATAAFEAGDVGRAVKVAEEVKAKATALASAPGLAVAPAAVAVR